jgi:hypothetical protein
VTPIKAGRPTIDQLKQSWNECTLTQKSDATEAKMSQSLSKVRLLAEMSSHTQARLTQFAPPASNSA